MLALSTYHFINIMGNKIKKNVISYMETETNKMIIFLINKTINLEDLEKFNLDEIFIIKRNGDKIETIDINAALVNEIVIDISLKLQKNLKYLEKGQIEKLSFKDDFLTEFNTGKKGKGIYYKVPMGVMFDNPILSNFGARVPIKYSLVGDIGVNFENEIKSYGINSSVLEIYLVVEINEKIILPLITKEIKVKSSTPIAYKIIFGEIPEYYLSSDDKIVIPVE